MTLKATAEQWLSSGMFTDTRAFWKTTLYDMVLILRGISQKNRSEIRMRNIYEGNLLAMIVNTTPRKSSKTYQWTDFYQDTQEPQHKEMTTQDISEKLHAMFGGA